MEHQIRILGCCPECGSLRTGLIMQGDNETWLRESGRLYGRHRCLLRCVSKEAYAEGYNRFCHDCGCQWHQPEGLFGRNRYVEMVYPDDESWQEFLDATRVSFDRCYPSRTRKRGREKLAGLFQKTWNLFFERIYRVK